MRYLVLVGKKRDIRQNGIESQSLWRPVLPSFDNLWRGAARDAGDPFDHAHRGFRRSAGAANRCLEEAEWRGWLDGKVLIPRGVHDLPLMIGNCNPELLHPRLEDIVFALSLRKRTDDPPYSGEDMSEEEKEKLLHDLNERVKELTVLHHTARLLQDPTRPSQTLLQEIATILPAAFDHVELACARVVFDGVEYRSTNLGSGQWKQSAHFTTSSGKHGAVEIAYAENKGVQSRPSFLPEEKSLLESVAEMLQLYLERKEAQESVERITQELVARNKELWNLQQEAGRVGQAAALGWMTGAIAHELGTPLNSVLGYTQLLAQEDLPEKARRHAKTIESQVQRMANIVQYYLDRTRGSISKRGHVNLNELVQETLLLLKPVFTEKNVQVAAQLADSLPSLAAHSGSLQRVLINLLNNAVDSLGRERKITISTQSARQTEEGRTGIIVEISDTGSGIAPDVLPKVFDFFITTKDPGSGTGLGLAVCREIVKEHGGKIAITSQIEKGTTVRIFLPAEAEADRGNG